MNGSSQQLVRQRWWISIDTFRLICAANSLDYSSLDQVDGTPSEWVACLVDDRLSAATAISTMSPPMATQVHSAAVGSSSIIPDISLKSFDSELEAATAHAKSSRLCNIQPVKEVELAGSNSAEELSAVGSNSVPKSASETAGGSLVSEADLTHSLSNHAKTPLNRTLALPSALIDTWCQFARRNVTHITEATGFIHFELSCSHVNGRRMVSPENYIVAFPNKDRGRQRYHSGLLTLRVVKEVDVPVAYATAHADLGCAGTCTEYVEFELLMRVHDSPVQQQLQITMGPVRANPQTGQRESMRIDLGRCLRQISTELVDDPRGKRVVRSRWWVSIETLRLICTANGLDCKSLDEHGEPASEWVTCLVDEKSAKSAAGQHLDAQPVVEKQPEESRNIDDLVEFIAGKVGTSKKRKKKKEREKDAAGIAATSVAMPLSASQATAAALSPRSAGLGIGAADTPLHGMPRGDPIAQAQAAAQLLAQAAASCSTPQQAAVAVAAAAAAQRAAEALTFRGAHHHHGKPRSMSAKPSELATP